MLDVWVDYYLGVSGFDYVHLFLDPADAQLDVKARFGRWGDRVRAQALPARNQVRDRSGSQRIAAGWGGWGGWVGGKRGGGRKWGGAGQAAGEEQAASSGRQRPAASRRLPEAT
jgi:hypothetical protein